MKLKEYINYLNNLPKSCLNYDVALLFIDSDGRSQQGDIFLDCLKIHKKKKIKFIVKESQDSE
jgi:hypothetical protein